MKNVTTASANQRGSVELLLTPMVDNSDYTNLDNARVSLQFASVETPEIDPWTVNFFLRDPKISIRLISLPDSFPSGDGHSRIYVEVQWRSNSTFDSPCTPRRVILHTRSARGSERVPYPALSIDLRPSEPKVQQINYIRPTSSGWIDSDDLTISAWMLDEYYPLTARFSDSQSIETVEVTSVFVSSTIVSINMAPVKQIVGITCAAVASIAIGYCLGRWRRRCKQQANFRPYVVLATPENEFESGWSSREQDESPVPPALSPKSPRRQEKDEKQD